MLRSASVAVAFLYVLAIALILYSGSLLLTERGVGMLTESRVLMSGLVIAMLASVAYCHFKIAALEKRFLLLSSVTSVLLLATIIVGILVLGSGSSGEILLLLIPTSLLFLIATFIFALCQSGSRKPV